jgi:hypothetical protein
MKCKTDIPAITVKAASTNNILIFSDIRTALVYEAKRILSKNLSVYLYIFGFVQAINMRAKNIYSLNKLINKMNMKHYICVPFLFNVFLKMFWHDLKGILREIDDKNIKTI